jgi:hypothetical protein
MRWLVLPSVVSPGVKFKLQSIRGDGFSVKVYLGELQEASPVPAALLYVMLRGNSSESIVCCIWKGWPRLGLRQAGGNYRGAG